MTFYVYWVTSGAWEGPARASGPVKALEDLSSFASRGSSFSLSLDRLMGASEVWSLCA